MKSVLNWSQQTAGTQIRRLNLIILPKRWLLLWLRMSECLGISSLQIWAEDKLKWSRDFTLALGKSVLAWITNFSSRVKHSLSGRPALCSVPTSLDQHGQRRPDRSHSSGILKQPMIVSWLLWLVSWWYQSKQPRYVFCQLSFWCDITMTPLCTGSRSI